jgi:hypothetical protein
LKKHSLLRKILTVAAVPVIVATSLTVNASPAAAAGPSCPDNGSATPATQGRWNHNTSAAAGTYAASRYWCIFNEPRNRRLVWQSDGHLVVYSGAHSGGSATWSGHTYVGASGRLVFQQDGNVVVYYANGTPKWSTGTGLGATLPDQYQLEFSMQIEHLDGRNVLTVKAWQPSTNYNPYANRPHGRGAIIPIG